VTIRYRINEKTVAMQSGVAPRGTELVDPVMIDVGAVLLNAAGDAEMELETGFHYDAPGLPQRTKDRTTETPE
jgi:hypothetical protein